MTRHLEQQYQFPTSQVSVTKLRGASDMELTELEERALAELSEFWRENFPTLANTVSDGSGTDAELQALKAAFEGLVAAGFAVVGIADDNATQLERLSKEESQAVLSEISQHLRLKPDHGHWTGGERPWPELAITDAGRAQADAILEKYGGERWWLRPN